MFTIGLDVRAAEPGFKAHYGRGTGRYATELGRHLLDIDASDTLTRVVPITARNLEGTAWEERMLNILPFGRQTAHTQLFLPRRLGKLRVDWLHFLAHGDATARCPLPYLVTVLDLIPLRFPDLYRAKKPGWRFQLARDLERQAIEKAHGIIAISEATKRDVVEMLNVPEDKVFVTHLGVGSEFSARSLLTAEWQAEGNVLKDRLGLPKERPVLLYAGGIDPRKNVLMLLRVFAEVLKQRLGARPVLALVGAYEQDDCFPELKAEIDRLEISGDVRLLGFLKEADLPGLYRAAHVKLFPSLYEGFGLPVLEAMASGLPVIASNNSSIPEVAGNGALLLDAEDERAWVQAIVSVLLNETRQGQLSAAGKTQARRFTWDNTAAQTLAAYEYFRFRAARAPERETVSAEKPPEHPEAGTPLADVGASGQNDCEERTKNGF